MSSAATRRIPPPWTCAATMRSTSAAIESNAPTPCETELAISSPLLYWRTGLAAFSVASALLVISWLPFGRYGWHTPAWYDFLRRTESSLSSIEN